MSNFESTRKKVCIFAVTIWIAHAIGMASANSAQITLRNGGTTANFIGEFTKGTTEKVKSFLNRHPRVNSVVLESDGGILGEGVRLGILFDERKINTHVLKGDRCVSACALAFLGGPEQALKGIVAFHRPAPINIRGKSRSELNEEGQFIGAYVQWYISKMGYSMQLSHVILQQTTKTKFLVFRSKGPLDAYYVGNPMNTVASRFLDDWKLDGNSIQSRLEVLR